MGHSRAKIRCGECGYYVEVPPGLRATDSEPDDDLPVITPITAPKSVPSTETSPGTISRASRQRDQQEELPDLFERDEPAPARKRTTAKAPTAKSLKAIARENPNPRDRRPEFVIPDGADLGPNLLEGTQEEHDDQAIPYAVPGDGTKNCQECHFRLPLDAAFCVNCGLDFTTKKKPKKRFEPIAQEWEPRLNFTMRIQIFAGLQVLNVLIILAFRSDMGFLGSVMALFFQGALQAFLIGTYEKLAVQRTAKGEATLTKTWRFFFIPTMPAPIDWKKSHAVGVINTHTIGLLEWMTFFYLLLLFVVPGLVFYWLVIHPMRYQVVLCDVYGSVDEVIYRTTSDEQTEEVCQVVSRATGLMYKTTM